MSDFTIYDDDREPFVEKLGVWMQVCPPLMAQYDRSKYINLSVRVDIYGLIDEVTGMFLGQHSNKWSHETQREVYDYLQEWELIVLRSISPEDSEWFATTKLCKEYGEDV